MRRSITGGRIGLVAAGMVLAAILLLSGCTRLLESEGIKFNEPARDEIPATSAEEDAESQAPAGEDGEPADAVSAAERYRIFRGTGQVIGESGRTRPAISEGPDGDITLNFVDADVREVLKATLGGILQANYVVSPEVQGAVTVQSSRPIARDALLPTLEAVLRLNGLAIVSDAGIYRVQPLQGAARGNATLRLGLSSAGDGYGVRIVPLAYISAAKMAETLRPISREGAILHIDETRNFLIVGGTRFELSALLEAVDIFDVNWLSGMSFGLFTLEFAEARALSDELTSILGEGGQGPVAGLVRLVPVERMNAILAVSRQPRYLTEVRRWIERLDQGGQDSSDRRLNIYFVQNGKAADLAPVLSSVFTGDGTASVATRATGELAPGLEPVEIASAEQPTAGGDAGGVPTTRTSPAARTASSSTTGISLSESGTLRIVADEERNALLISGSAREHRAVLRALKQLDRRPLEVLIEVTIADVTLSNRLEYGIRWFFQTDSGRHLITQSDLNTGSVASTFPGLSYVYSATNAKAVLDLLSSVTDVEVISAPQLLVLNNQEAQLQVGAQVPVATQQSESTDALGDPVIVSTIELKDTGVILNVTPRVNDSGLIILDIQQEVSQVSEDAAAGTLTPTISKRIITTSVAVQSGQTVALGGLIQDNRNNTKVGVPILSAIPFLGALFRYTTDTVSRSELLVLVSPRIVRDERDALEATAELRRRMEDLGRLERKIDKTK